MRNIREILNFISEIFTKTYGEIISSQQINERMKFLEDNLSNLSPLSIMKTILYSDTDNEIGKLALDFRLRFITSDYQNVITSSESYELDNFPGLLGDELRREIKETCIVINHFLLKIHLSKKNCKNCIIKLHKEFEHLLSLRYKEKSGTFWNIRNGIISKLSKNQRCFMACYGIDIEMEEQLSDKIIASIRNGENDNARCRLIDLTKQRHHHINNDLVLNLNFFG